MTQAGKNPTIYDLARLAGASPSTVSAALGDAWKSRRISAEKVAAIRKLATEAGYAPNMQARGLRRAQSGLVGMVIPVHDNRFFTSLSQSFEAVARERGLVPVIASTMRNAAEEVRIIETLASYRVDYLFIAGATDAEAISATCRAANLRHVFLDLPGRSAPSVVSDNYAGAAQLTEALIADSAARRGGDPGLLCFLGGDAGDHATSRRIEGFRDRMTRAGLPPDERQIIACGYAPRRAREEIDALCQRLGALPDGLFVNSLTVFEGVLGHFVRLAPEAFDGKVIGCYDYDPFAAFLQFPVHMVRQDSQRLVEEAYRLIDDPPGTPTLREVAPQLIPPRTIPSGAFAEHG
jgi:LacI family transcriptional regulator, fructose operon transcriptional repressor